MNEIVQVINNVGFPIACAMGVGYMYYRTSKDNREDNAKREERMFSQLDKFADSMDRFNATLNTISDRVGRVEEKVGVDNE